jgi:hypothetical protein
MSKRINITVTDRDYNLLIEVTERFYNRMKIGTAVKLMSLHRAEELVELNSKKSKFKQLDLLKDGE